MVHSRGAARRHRREDGPGTLDRLHRRPTPRQLVGQRVNPPTTARLGAPDEEQGDVATHCDPPVIVLAGAATGKTRAMPHRIAYGSATEVCPPTQVLALTFTAKAAGEMRSRLRGLGVPAVQARTFHSAALRQLRFFWDRFAEGDFPRIIENKAG